MTLRELIKSADSSVIVARRGYHDLYAYSFPDCELIRKITLSFESERARVGVSADGSWVVAADYDGHLAVRSLSAGCSSDPVTDADFRVAGKIDSLCVSRRHIAVLDQNGGCDWMSLDGVVVGRTAGVSSVHLGSMEGVLRRKSGLVSVSHVSEPVSHLLLDSDEYPVACASGVGSFYVSFVERRLVRVDQSRGAVGAEVVLEPDWQIRDMALAGKRLVTIEWDYVEGLAWRASVRDARTLETTSQMAFAEPAPPILLALSWGCVISENWDLLCPESGEKTVLRGDWGVGA